MVCGFRQFIQTVLSNSALALVTSMAGITISPAFGLDLSEAIEQSQNEMLEQNKVAIEQKQLRRMAARHSKVREVMIIGEDGSILDSRPVETEQMNEIDRMPASAN